MPYRNQPEPGVQPGRGAIGVDAAGPEIPWLHRSGRDPLGMRPVQLPAEQPPADPAATPLRMHAAERRHALPAGPGPRCAGITSDRAIDRQQAVERRIPVELGERLPETLCGDNGRFPVVPANRSDQRGELRQIRRRERSPVEVGHPPIGRLNVIAVWIVRNPIRSYTPTAPDGLAVSTPRFAVVTPAARYASNAVAIRAEATPLRRHGRRVPIVVIVIRVGSANAMLSR